MRIIAFTDIHGSYKKVNDILSKERDYDTIIIGGDLTTLGSPKEAEEAVKLFQSHAKPVLAVAGNMDPRTLEQSFENLGISINGKGIIIGSAGFFGVSASPISPLHTPYEISEDEIKRLAEAGWSNIQDAKWKIFVPHAPPRDTKLDKVHVGLHVGSTAVRTFIEKHQPDVVVCGHIHEARGKDAIGTSQIVNCGPAGKGCYAMITLTDTVSVETMG